jgi:hypothetical protein
VWNEQRLARRTRTQDVNSWLDIVQADIDSSVFGDALRELADLMKAYPNSSEARSLVTDIERLRNLR